MKRALLLGAGVLLALVLLGGGAVVLLPLSPGSRLLRGRMPLPVACAASACVTYASWSTTVQRDDRGRGPLEILTALLEDQALAIVASREGVRVTRAEIEQALDAFGEALGSIPGGREFIAERFGPSAPRSLRGGMYTLLIREKLAAQGITSPWVVRGPPTITVWNIHLRWDATAHRVVTRSAGSLAGAREVR